MTQILPDKTKPVLRKLIILIKKRKIYAMLLLLLTALSISYVIPVIYGWNRHSSNIKDIPDKEYGLLLGCSPGSEAFINRINAAAKLLKAGKIDKIIVSGAEEVHAMKRSLLHHNIAENRIILDPDGYRTKQSIINIKEKFNVRSYTVISQKYHCERAIFLGSCFGAEVYGFDAADSVSSGHTRDICREILARVKMYFDCLCLLLK